MSVVNEVTDKVRLRNLITGAIRYVDWEALARSMRITPITAPIAMADEDMPEGSDDQSNAWAIEET